jgi:phosphate transport system substrate-binding protein
VNRRFLGLTLAVAAMASTSVASTAMAATPNGSLTGAGSTLMAPLMSNWAQDFESSHGIGITYGAVGSGAGIQQITARTVDFGASDAPLTAAQAGACNNCVQIPWALTATAVAFHLDGVKKLKLTGDVVAKIYMGQITNWNNKTIAKLNPGVKLPNLGITPVFRSDGSGDTYAFTDYLARVNPKFKSSIGTSTAVSFPKGVGGKGNDGITAVVSSTNGAIGYVSASYAIAHSLGVAALQNAAHRFEYPNLNNIAAAAKVVKRVPANNELHIVNPPASAKTAYPLSTFSYVIVPKGSPKASSLRVFILYAMGAAGQKFGPALDFAPIPGVVYKAAQASTNALG